MTAPPSPTCTSGALEAPARSSRESLLRRAANARRRARARGLTLVEVLIVIAVGTLLSGGMVFAGGQIQRSRLKSSSSRVAAAIRAGYQRASSSGKPLRLVMDVEK